MPAGDQDRDRVVRIGVLGCADIAGRRMLPSMVRQPLIRVVAVASREEAKARSFADRFGCEAVTGYERLLERPDIDAVYLPLPPELHAEWIGRALEAGKHVLCEKPLAATYAEATEAVASAREHGLLLMESFMFLYHAQHTVVAKLVADGRIGEPRVFTGDFAFPPVPAATGRYLARRGSALLEVGVYPLRAAQLFLGPRLDVVGACLRSEPGRGEDVAGSALLVSAGGCTAQLNFGFEHFYRCSYSLWGSEGRISLHRAFTPPDTLSPVVRIESQDHREELTLPPDQQFTNIAGAFAEAILEGADFTPYGEAILRQARLVDAIRSRAAAVMPR